MSDPAEALTSRETPEAPGYDVSSPPLYSYQGQQPPPYSAAPELGPPPKMETTCIHQPTTGHESFWDIGPEGPSDTTPLMASSAFHDTAVMRAFVRKVLGILSLQLLFLSSVQCVLTFTRGWAERTNWWAYNSSIIIFVVVGVALSSCKSFRRRHPWNIVGLVVVTVSLSYLVGAVASFHDTTDVVITMGATMAVSVAIIAFSAQTLDFTIWYGALLILTVDVIIFKFMHLLLIYHR